MSALALRRLALAGVLVCANVPSVVGQDAEPHTSMQPGLVPPPSAASVASCNHAAFAEEIVQPVPTRERRCIPPADAQLDALQQRVDAAIADAKRTAARRTAELQGALRALAARFGASTGWGASFARGIGLALEHPEQQRAVAPRFSDARTPVPGVDPDGCLFVVGDAGQSDYACFVLAGAPVPAPGPAAGEVVVLALRWQEAALAHRAFTIAQSALQKLDLPALAEARDRLREAEKRWDRLIDDGYLQYPWELAINGAFASYSDVAECATKPGHCSGAEGLDPESLRYIFLHPGVGAGFRGFGANGKPSADAALTLSLEVFGFTSYADDFSWYWGLSFGAGVDDGDFGDVRIGAFVHLTRWMHLGYLVSVMREASRKDATLFVSMDIGSGFGASFLE